MASARCRCVERVSSAAVQTGCYSRQGRDRVDLVVGASQRHDRQDAQEPQDQHAFCRSTHDSPRISRVALR